MLGDREFVTVYILRDNNYHASWYKSSEYMAQH